LGAFDDKHITRAIERLPTMATREIRELSARAERQDLASLRDACERELALSPIELSAVDAEAHARMATEVRVRERWRLASQCLVHDGAEAR